MHAPEKALGKHALLQNLEKKKAFDLSNNNLRMLAGACLASSRWARKKRSGLLFRSVCRSKPVCTFSVWWVKFLEKK